MQTKVQIRPIREKGNVVIVGEYTDSTTNRKKYLLAGGRKIVTTLTEGDRLYHHSFEKGSPLVLSFDKENLEDLQIINFWKNHPMIHTAGHKNPNLMFTQFELEIREEKVEVEYKALISKLDCVKVVGQLNPRERRDLAFALGSDPREMSDKELFVHLIGLTFDGIAVAKRAEVFAYKSVRQHEQQAMVYAQKAIKFGIITKEGAVYRVGGRNLGGSVDSVVATLLADDEFFKNYIRVEVDRIDKDDLADAEDLDDALLAGLPEGVAQLLAVTTSTNKKESAKTAKGKAALAAPATEQPTGDPPAGDPPADDPPLMRK